MTPSTDDGQGAKAKGAEPSQWPLGGTRPHVKGTAQQLGDARERRTVAAQSLATWGPATQRPTRNCMERNRLNKRAKCTLAITFATPIMILKGLDRPDTCRWKTN